MNVKTLFAFFAVYVVWGSTYLAIHYGVETIPPVTLSALRFLAAGLLMGLLALGAREPRLTRAQTKIAALSGSLLMLANALVCIAEMSLPSGLCAVIIGMVPVCIMLLSWVFFRGVRPTFMKLGGAALGVAGIALIAWDNIHFEGSSPLPFLLLFMSCFVWSFGTLVQRKLSDLRAPLLFSATQMFCGGIFVGTIALARREYRGFDITAVSLDSWLALAYLIVFGSIVAFSAYSWLSRHVESHIVSTYALVNPIVAAFLGIVIADEAFTFRFLVGLILVIVSLGLILRKQDRRVEASVRLVS